MINKPKILVIRFSSLGDLILMIPLLQSLRAYFPSAEIDLATKSKYAGLFKDADIIDRIHTLETGNLSELMRMRRLLADNEYDIIMDAHNVIRSNILYRTIPDGRKIQLKKEQLRKFLLIKWNLNMFRDITSQYRKYMNLAEEIGVGGTDHPPPFQLPLQAADKAEDILSVTDNPGEPVIAVAPGARWKTKRWSEEKFIAAMEMLEGRGFNLVLTGGAAESELAGRIAESVSGAVINTAGELTILETAAVLRRSDLLLTNDSALLHLAELVNTPVLALFGPTVREFGFYPRLDRSRVLEIDIGCRPCSRNGAKPCPHRVKACLDYIEPESVVENAISILREGNEKSGGWS